MNLQGSTIEIETLKIKLEEKSNSIFDARVKDELLKANIIKSLRWFSRIPLDKVTLTVKYGYLTLEGSVPWTYQRIVTTTMMQNIKGLKGITNNIKVVPYLISLGSIN